MTHQGSTDLGSTTPTLQPSIAKVADNIMTDRYTNAEWAVQIAETQRNVVAKLDVRPVPKLGSKEFAQTIDHTLLKLDATAAQIDQLCSEARVEGFKSVCVRLPFVARCVSNLKGCPVVVACVVGFHEGTYNSHAKFEEARKAVAAGASELDIVLNHSILTRVRAPSPSPSPPAPGSHRSVPSDTTTTESLTASNTASNAKPRPESSLARTEGPYSLLSPPSTADSHSSSAAASSSVSSEDQATTPDYESIYTELASLRTLCPSPVVLKLILETSQLTPAQILAASTLAAAANFDFIKTSTGFAGRGASLEDVVLMSAAAGYLVTRQPGSGGGSPVRRRKMEVKASGGVRSLEGAVKMLEAGATRLGTSSGLWIMQEARRMVKEGQGEVEKGKRPGGVTRLYTDSSDVY